MIDKKNAGFSSIASYNGHVVKIESICDIRIGHIHAHCWITNACDTISIPNAEIIARWVCCKKNGIKLRVTHIWRSRIVRIIRINVLHINCLQFFVELSMQSFWKLSNNFANAEIKKSLQQMKIKRWWICIFECAVRERAKENCIRCLPVISISDSRSLSRTSSLLPCVFSFALRAAESSFQ